MNDEHGMINTVPEDDNVDKPVFGNEVQPDRDESTDHAGEGTRAEPAKWKRIDCCAFGKALDAICKERAEEARRRKSRSSTVREAILRHARKIRTMLEDGYTCADIVDALKACGALVSPGTVRKYLHGDKKEKAKREKPIRKELETHSCNEKPATDDSTGEKHAVLKAPELSGGDRNWAGTPPTGLRTGEYAQQPPAAVGNATVASAGQSPAPAENREAPTFSTPADWRHGNLHPGGSAANPLAPKIPAYSQMIFNR